MLAVAGDLELAGGDDEHLVCRVALADQHLAGVEPQIGDDSGDRVELLAVEIVEQRDTLQVLVVLVLLHVPAPVACLALVAARHSMATGHRPIG